MTHGRVTKKLADSKPDGRIKVGRPQIEMTGLEL